MKMPDLPELFAGLEAWEEFEREMAAIVAGDPRNSGAALNLSIARERIKSYPTE